MNKLKLYLITALTVIYSSCKNHDKQTKVVIHPRAPINSKLYIKQLPFFDEQIKIVDSTIIKNNRDSIVLYVPKEEEHLFKIVVPNRRLEITFINDTKLVQIQADYFSEKYTVTGSPATTSVQAFEKNQEKVSTALREFAKPIDSLARNHIRGKQLDTLDAQFNRRLGNFFKKYIAYADTVKSPAAFVKVYNNIEFENEHKGLKEFILRNSARFPHYKPIQQIKKDAMATVRIYEEEFNVGDKLPPITLPDINGKPFSTNSLKGHYYLIDFWSTWCTQCMLFKVAQKKVLTTTNTKVKMISVAIDDQKHRWEQLISENKLDWTHLIDEKMWKGPAVNTLVFDSIPFNFLVSPEGKVIKKAITPDSLLKAISNLNR